MSLTYLNTMTEVSWGSGTRALSISQVWPYHSYMIKTKTEKAKPKTNKQFPLVIHGKRFETEAEYLDAIHEFLNGNWNEHTFSDW